VSDYSRYLPVDVSAPGVISWTYLGAAGSAAWLMSLGALLASAFPNPDIISSIQQVGNEVVPGLGTFVVVASAPALVTVMGVNVYGAMLTGASAVDAFRPVTPTLRVRIIGIVAISLIVLVIALSIPSQYLDSFNTFVLLMLYFLVPWTAVNLVDFYLVRHGHYAVTEIYNPDGIYGRWGWRGMIAYILGFAAMVPFFVTSFYTGPIASMLGGADISFAVGLTVSGLLYFALTRGIDLSREMPVIEASRRQLEGTAAVEERTRQ
jgi:NCS1 family nucleobase:cation symporter-1